MAGVQIEFVAVKTLHGKDADEKAKYIINAVKKERKILILEEALSREEERVLYQLTMENVSKDFPGIEISSFGEEAPGVRQALIALLGGKKAGLTIIGPSNLVKQIKKDPDKLRFLAGS
ncbi:MAG: DUF2073 domain-containing protein [Candidatus Micrarchaeota archaeon]